MIQHNGKVFSFKIEDKLFELFRIKTVRRHLIYVDSFGHYYASWNDFWHVFNNLENSRDKHWSIYEPEFIHRDHRRFILKELSRFKSLTKAENWDVYLESWSKWEKILFDSEISLEIDLSETPISEKLQYIGFHYGKFSSLEEMIKNIESDYLNSFLPSPSYNENWIFINTYSGQKVVERPQKTLEDAQILPGNILLVKIID
jgi:hypothetical protein